MASTLERFREDLTKLVKQGQRLRLSMKLRCFPEKYTAAFKERYGDEADAIIKDLPDFIAEYQRGRRACRRRSRKVFVPSLRGPQNQIKQKETDDRGL